MGNCVPYKHVVIRSITSKSKLLILVIGGPCSGKSSIAHHLSTHFQLLPISVDQIIRECVDREALKKPEVRLENLHKRRLGTYNALLIHNKMTKEAKEFLGKGESVGVSMSSNHFSFHRQSDSDDDEFVGPPQVREIQKSLNRGEPINPDIITTLIHDTMWYAVNKCNGFVIDGYPRDVEQFESLVAKIGDPHMVVFLECPDKVMIDRALNRAQAAQRFDDNEPYLNMKIKAFLRNLANLSEIWTQKGIPVLNVNGTSGLEHVKTQSVSQVETKIPGNFRFKKFRDWYKISGEERDGGGKRSSKANGKEMDAPKVK